MKEAIEGGGGVLAAVINEHRLPDELNLLNDF